MKQPDTATDDSREGKQTDLTLNRFVSHPYLYAENTKGEKFKILTNPDFVSGVYLAVYPPGFDIPLQQVCAHSGFKKRWAKLKKMIIEDGFTIKECHDEIPESVLQRVAPELIKKGPKKKK